MRPLTAHVKPKTKEGKCQKDPAKPSPGWVWCETEPRFILRDADCMDLSLSEQECRLSWERQGGAEGADKFLT